VKSLFATARIASLCLGSLVLSSLFLVAQGAEPGRDPEALARRIDEHINSALRQAGVEPAPRADDAEFLRRVYLDLTGRILRAAEVREFLADESPDKRKRIIATLLAHPRHAVHQANVWRAELLPEATSDRQAALLQPGFENWLIQQFRQKVSYDRLARELITVPLPAVGQPAEPILRAPQRPNPLAFIAAKGSRPENIAAAVTRTFLGIRLECAECHNHPFATWTQEQFWNQAAFFGGLQKQGSGLFAPLNEDPNCLTVTYEQEKKVYDAAFLTGESLPAQPRSGREMLANWLTSPGNPYFTKAGANRIWGQLFGVGLVEPVDDFHDDNPPSHPELLADLAREFAAGGFQPDYLITAICLTDAYQRTSARTDPSQDKTPLPARMTVKGLTGEQFFESLSLAVGYQDHMDGGRARREFVSRFTRLTAPSEPETSVQQALTLLNGRFVATVTNPQKNPTLIAVRETPGLTEQERIEMLYLSTLSRLPTAAELDRLASARSASGNDEGEFYADLFWLLLNTAEFRLNH
jgi:hypothetical protein